MRCPAQKRRRKRPIAELAAIASISLMTKIIAGAQFKRENEWCMRGIAGDAYADGVQDCLKEIVSRSYIARRKQIEAQRKRSEQVDDKK